VKVSGVERLGQDNSNDRRPLKVVLRDPKSRATVLEKAKNLKQSTYQFQKIYIKKDLNPSIRREMARLRDVTKRKKEKPENMAKKCFWITPKRKCMWITWRSTASKLSLFRIRETTENFIMQY
jgi:hypothetical protein